MSAKKDFIFLMKEGKLKNLYSETSKKAIKKYFLELQNNKCSICGIENIWNDNILVFVLDHIDGNSKDNTESNLRMICPNCDSQTPTFKSKNKGKGRDYDREYKQRRHTRKLVTG